MEETALEMLPVKTLVSFNSCIRFKVLDVREPFARSEAGVEGNVNLEWSAIILVERL